MIDEVVGGLGYVGQRLADDSDRDAYRAWLRQYLAAAMREVGWEAKAGESDEQKTLRSRLLGALGYDARDPEALAEAHKIADQALADPSSVDQDLAGRALRLAALEGNSEFYDKLIAAMKNPKSPE